MSYFYNCLNAVWQTWKWHLKVREAYKYALPLPPTLPPHHNTDLTNLHHKMKYLDSKSVSGTQTPISESVDVKDGQMCDGDGDVIMSTVSVRYSGGLVAGRGGRRGRPAPKNSRASSMDYFTATYSAMPKIKLQPRKIGKMSKMLKCRNFFLKKNRFTKP